MKQLLFVGEFSAGWVNEGDAGYLFIFARCGSRSVNCPISCQTIAAVHAMSSALFLVSQGTDIASVMVVSRVAEKDAGQYGV